jgi:hypothetical protein
VALHRTFNRRVGRGNRLNTHHFHPCDRY